MKQRIGFFLAALAAAFLITGTTSAQITQAAGYTPPDDTPSIKVGGTIYANFEYTQEPRATDSDGNQFHQNSFNVTRAYINITGQINHWLSFRITPDVVRVGQVDGKDVAGLTGTLTYRLKYAFGQLNLDDLDQTVGVAQWKGSWVRLGLQQTPFVDYAEQIYRYRFQGTIFVEREGFLTSSDLGASAHVNLPDNYGDVHVGYYNGEGYTRPELNNTKAFQVRGTLRPAPNVEILKGLRFTGFYDKDEYVTDAKRERTIAEATFENPYVNAGFDYLWAKDQNASSTKPVVKSSGYSGWVTPRFPCGFEALFRFDYFTPVDDTPQRKQRFIVGPAYWFTTLKGVNASVLLGYEQVKYAHFTPSRPIEERYGVYTLFNF
jgi:hypothetical protein